MRRAKRRRKARSPQAADVLEQRALLTTFVGTATATFENAVGGVSDGEGTPTFNWGSSYQGNEINEFSVITNDIDVRHGNHFSLGSLSYFNGITETDSDSSAVDLVISVEITAPKLDSAQTIEKTLTMNPTPNTGSSEENADTVTLGGETSTNFRLGGRTFALNVLGFGTTTDNTFTPVDELVVEELESTTVELIAEFVPLSDLKTTGLSTDAASFVGSETSFEMTIANRGNGAAQDGFKAQLVLSTSPTLDEGTHMVIHEVETTKRLKPGRRMKMKGTFTLPANLSHDYSGKVYLGVIVDPDGLVNEGNENNNVPTRLRRKLALFDPVASAETWTDSENNPVTFESRRAALDFLKEQGYQRLRQDQRGERSLPMESTFSRRTGEMMEAGAFRTVAVPTKTDEPGVWVIERRVGEPTPGSVKQWKSRFESRSNAAAYLRLWNRMSDELFQDG